MALTTAQPGRPTVVLVHGAFAESASWAGVIAILADDGYPVVAVANPLRGVRHDADYDVTTWGARPRSRDRRRGGGPEVITGSVPGRGVPLPIR
ncbi:hypothetical protein ABZ436_26665 [Micromonospora matsumotoense]|uniref:hypothetical protein n=1 Tax=Micromonospora matsumotoense TaxID=121616 RepID=UPI0033FF645E